MTPPLHAWLPTDHRRPMLVIFCDFRVTGEAEKGLMCKSSVQVMTRLGQKYSRVTLYLMLTCVQNYYRYIIISIRKDWHSSAVSLSSSSRQHCLINNLRTDISYMEFTLFWPDLIKKNLFPCASNLWDAHDKALVKIVTPVLCAVIPLWPFSSLLHYRLMWLQSPQSLAGVRNLWHLSPLTWWDGLQWVCWTTVDPKHI